MDLPEPPVWTVTAFSARDRRQTGRPQGRLLRLLAAGCLTALLLGAVPLANWAASNDWTADIPAIQTLASGVKNATESLGLAKPYDWIRQIARALQHLRFGPADDQQ
jgi:hypothetical protein